MILKGKISWVTQLTPRVILLPFLFIYFSIFHYVEFFLKIFLLASIWLLLNEVAHNKEEFFWFIYHIQLYDINILKQ
jgi:hypothetical protein